MPVALPAPPVLGFSFTSFSTNSPTAQQPGTNLDAEFNRTNAAVAAIIAFLQVSLNADGTLNSSAVETAYNALAGGNAYGEGDNVADAPSALSALLAQAWAEYMPDELPADTLAGTGITGDHYSARYWANQAAVQTTAQAQALAAYEASVNGQIAAGEVTIVSAVTVVPINALTGLNGVTTSFALVRSDTNGIAVPDSAAELLVVQDGLPQHPGVDFTLFGSTITFTTAPPADATIWITWIAPGATAGTGTPNTLDGGTF